MSYHAFGGETLSEAVARNRAAICPNPGCGKPGLKRAAGDMVYHPHNGITRASIQATLYWCPNCGIWFAREEK